MLASQSFGEVRAVRAGGDDSKTRLSSTFAEITSDAEVLPPLYFRYFRFRSLRSIQVRVFMVGLGRTDTLLLQMPQTVRAWACARDGGLHANDQMHAVSCMTGHVHLAVADGGIGGRLLLGRGG